MANKRIKSQGENNHVLVTNHRWVLARSLVQYLSLAVFIYLFLMTTRNGLPANVVNIPMRLDPLLMLSNLLAGRTFLLASTLALLTVLLTIIFGRAWCGWLCPLGTTLDIFSFKRSRGKRLPPPEGWRKIKYVLLAAVLISAILGNLTLLILDPLTLLFRTLTTAMLPAIDQIIIASETGLYQVPIFSDPISSFDQWIRPALLPQYPLYFRDTLLFASIFFIVIVLNLFAPRFWCRYLCPLGGFLGLLSRIALFRREVTEPCKGCSLCTAACPTGTINPAKNYASDAAECTMCMECLETCPRSMIRFSPGFSFAPGQDYDPDRREALLTLGGTIAVLALVKSNQLAKRQPNFLIRPPGARESNPDILDMTKCIRCSECMRACPTNALQPAVFEAGIQGFGSPILVARLGYCEFSCNTCGQVCPVQAIPPLSLEEKQSQAIGKAYIDESRCIAWSDHNDCIVCEEMCPLPEKAIQLEETDVWAVDNSVVKVKLPHVLRDRCIGCGICEYKCPLNGDAAIRVYTPQTAVPF
jgi:polyferredoxin